MFIELIELLRCPAAHEESWLVAAFGRMDGRFVIEGKLGCPVCSCTFPIVEGVARFSEIPVEAHAGDTHATNDETIRTAALLGLTRAGATIVMEGPDAATCAAVAEMTEARAFVVNGFSARRNERVGIVTAAERLPFPSHAVDGVVLTSPSGPRLEEAARILKPGGRLVAAHDVNVSPHFRELARDDRNVVGEAVGPLVSLSRQS